MKKFQLVGASLFALTVASPSFAQTTPTAEEDTSADIIVTASKRVQTLQDVPISVAVASGERVEQSQIRDLIDIQTLVPSLKVGQQRSSANTSFYIRGFGNGANNAGIEPSVGVFIDGVYRSRSAAQIGDLPNIERVEVLRGPQSTLFGKNASAGIISITTAAPSATLGGNIEASYGNYNAVVVKGVITGPITDTLGFALSGNYNRRDGYARYVNLNQNVNDRNRFGGRAQLLFQPSSDLKIRLIADYDKIDENCCIATNLFDGPTGAIIRALGGNVNSNQPFSYNGYANFQSTNKIDNYGVSGQVDWNIGNGLSVTSITAYRGVRSNDDQDSDFTSADLIGRNATYTKIDTFTQELRLTSNFDGPLNFLVGGYYFDEKIDQTNQLLFGTQFRPYGDALIRGASGNALNVALLEGTFGALEGAPTKYAGTFFRSGDGLNEAYRLSNRSFSFFGTVDFKITDQLTLTGGLNYTDDRKTLSTATVSNDVWSSINLDAAAYTPFRQALLVGQGVPVATAAFLAANPTTTLPDGRSANPLAGLKALQFLPPFLNLPNAVESGKTNDTNLSYTGRLAFKANRNLNFYLTYGTGFKASSVNLSRDSRPTPDDLVKIRGAGIATVNLTSGSRFAAPEEAEVFEAGMKGNWQGFSFSLALFKQTLRGFQSNVFQGTGFVLGNAEKQSTQGFEVDASLTPVRNLNFTASVTYLDPKYDLFTSGSTFNPATNTAILANLTGQMPSGISPWSVAVGTTYTQRLSDTMKAIFYVDYSLASRFVIAQGLPYSASPENLNASATLSFNNSFEVTVWGRNLTEPQYNSVILPGVAQQGSLSAYPSPPRTYGISGRFRF